MQDQIIEIAIKTFTQELISESKNLFGYASEEVKQFFNKGVKNYFQKQREKYSYIKTLLQGNTPVQLYDIYYPINVTKRWKTINCEKISNLFKDTSYITIIGSAGSGKSTLLKHLFLTSIAEKFGIPILIELRNLNDYNGTIEEFIFATILELELSQNQSILKRLLSKGKFVLFLDGFDEVTGDLKDEIIKEVNKFIDKYDNNKYILTSRPYADIELLPLFHNCHINALKKNDVKKFIILQLKNEEELANRIIESIENNQIKYIQSFLSNPLLLSLYILTFQSNSEIPNKKYIFYRRVIQALFSEHDSKSKLGFVREKSCVLSQEEFENILKRFSILSFFNKKYAFDIDYVLQLFDKIKTRLNRSNFNTHELIKDLKLAYALWVEDGNKLKFAHKSIQEYFAALFIRELREEQKKTMYSKITDSLRNLTEIENFISLCKEMDEIDYTKHFLIPIIKDELEFFSNNDEDILIKLIVLRFFSAIAVTESNEFVPWAVSHPTYKIKEIYNLIAKLKNYLWKEMEKIALGNIVNSAVWTVGMEDLTGRGVETVWYLDLAPYHDEITVHLKNSGIKDYLIDILNCLKQMKDQKLNFVLKSEKSNDDLIDMI